MGTIFARNWRAGALVGIVATALAGVLWMESRAEIAAPVRVAEETEARIKALEKTVASLTAQVGKQERAPTVFNSIERRFRDQEQRNAELDRELRKLDERLRKLENTRR